MKKPTQLIMTLSIFTIFFGATREKAIVLTSSPVAVVELFTSQGCSSCPAADKLLNDVISAAQAKGTAVIGLSWHVSYWNYLGWKDPYSNEQYTAKQKEYATVMKLSSIYTPQVIVNGTTEFVGSDARALNSSIAAALLEAPKYQLSATASADGKDVLLKYAVDKPTNGEVLSVAVVESYVQNEVPRGENRGLTLKHFNVVRKLEKTRLETSANVKVNARTFGGGTSIVLYIQEPATLKILGAVKIGLKG